LEKNEATHRPKVFSAQNVNIRMHRIREFSEWGEVDILKILMLTKIEKLKNMINQLLKERLTKTESLAHQILVGLAAVYVFYCRFTQSGPVRWLDGVQANMLDGEYYPVLSLVLCLALFIVPLSGLFLLYAHLKK
jgi:hypothetical protein